MRRIVALAVLAVGVGQSAAAQELYDPHILSACLDSTPTAQAERCIGLAAARCMEGGAGGTTVGMGVCYGAELRQWDDLLNSKYRALKHAHQASEEAGDYDHLGDRFPRPVGALRDMQRAWIVFRDAACTHELSQWGGGTGGGPAETACLMTQTARQTLWLQTALDGWGG